MKLITVIFTATFSLLAGKPTEVAVLQQRSQQGYIDAAAIEMFTSQYKEYNKLESNLKELYGKDSTYKWFDKKGMVDFAEVVYNNANQMDQEGLPVSFPYKDVYADIFSGGRQVAATPENELLISSLYLYYNQKVHRGLDHEQSRLTGWHLPRESADHNYYPGSLKVQFQYFSQYYNLKEALKKYRTIENNGGWGTINFEKSKMPLRPGDTSAIVSQVRKRLYTEGYLYYNSGSNGYNEELAAAIANYRESQYKSNDSLITAELLNDLNISVSERIKSIAVNMERCRWITISMNDVKEFIAVNIPSFRLHYFREGKPFLTSKVVVGKEATKTVVFSGDISYLVFSPYWNVPNSILQNEIMPEIKKNPNYLAAHDMEWAGNRIRQRPGPKNPLGQVKFIFPNSNNIYLHDTPSKSLFNRDERAFSHGCIRVEKAHELAVAIMEKEAGWTREKTEAAMNSGKENTYVLKNKIPVYIAYFTVWADADGNVSFFDDIYNRDSRLAQLLFEN